jgi:hypothetical protein
MGKILLGAIIGVFIGAFVAEIMRRKRPRTIKKIEAKAAELVDSMLGPDEAPDEA